MPAPTLKARLRSVAGVWWAPVLVGIVFRAGVHIAVPMVRPRGDMVVYDKLAYSIATGHGIAIKGEPSARRLPMAPLVFAAAYAVAGRSYAAVAVVGTLLSALLVLAVRRLGLLLYDEKRASWAAWLVALNPALAVYSGVTLSELPFATLTTLTLLCFALLVLAPTWRVSVLSGVCLGLALLCRSTAVVTLLPIIVITHWLQPPGRRSWVRTIATGAIGIAFVTGWIARNWVVLGRVVYEQSLNEALYVRATIPLDVAPGRTEHEQRHYRQQLEAQTDDAETASTREAVRQVAAHPMNFVRPIPLLLSTILKLDAVPTVMFRDGVWANANPLVATSICALAAATALYIPLGATGAACYGGNAPIRRLLTAHLVLLWLTALLSSTPRYRLHSEPILVILATGPLSAGLSPIPWAERPRLRLAQMAVVSAAWVWPLAMWARQLWEDLPRALALIK